MEELAGGERVVESAMRRCVAQAEPIGQRAEFAIGDFIA